MYVYVQGIRAHARAFLPRALCVMLMPHTVPAQSPTETAHLRTHTHRTTGPEAFLPATHAPNNFQVRWRCRTCSRLPRTLKVVGGQHVASGGCGVQSKRAEVGPALQEEERGTGFEEWLEVGARLVLADVGGCHQDVHRPLVRRGVEDGVERCIFLRNAISAHRRYQVDVSCVDVLFECFFRALPKPIRGFSPARGSLALAPNEVGTGS